MVVAAIVFFAAFFTYAHADLPDIFYHLVVDGFLLLIWLVAAWGYGGVLLSGKSLLVHVTRLALGLGILSLLILFLGLAGVLGELVALVLLGAGFILALIEIAHHWPAEKPVQPAKNQWLTRRAGWHWLLLILMPFTGLMFAGGLIMPGLLWGADDPSGYDVVEYHLQVPREWYEAHRIVPLHHNVFSYFPFNVEMHYLLAMELHADPWAGMFLAQWMHAAFIVLTIVAIYAAARIVSSPMAACVAALAAGVCPWLPMLGSVAYDEGGLLLYTTLALAWLLLAFKADAIRFSKSDLRISISAGLCAGLACGCKLTAVPITLLALPVIFFFCRFSRRTLAMAIIYVFAGLLAFSPWLIRNQFWAHNPVFPEGISLLGPGDFSPIEVARWHQAHSPRPDQAGVARHLLAFWQQIIADWQYAYVLLPLSIIFGLVAVRRRQSVFMLLVLLAMILFWLLLTHLQSRFFVLAIPMMALLLPMASEKLLRPCAVLIALSAIPAFIGLHQRLMPLSVTVGLESPSLLRSQLYPTAVNAAISQSDKPIILVGDAKAFWFNIPMSRLYYRTVFDVNTKPDQSIVQAWINGAARLPDADVIIDPAELNRFHRTYLGIPMLPPQFQYLRESTVFDLHDLIPATKQE